MSTASLSFSSRLKRNVEALSREQADTLLLLAVVALVVVPHFAHLPIWAVSISITVLLWRGYLALRMYSLPSKWILLLLLVGCVLGTLISFRTIAGRDAGVTLVLMLIALKTLELRARRDAMVIFFLGFFAVLTHFLFSQSLFTAAMMIIAVLGLLTALVGAHMPVGRPALKLRVKLAAKMLILGTPLAAALFIFFPRLSGPLWGMPESVRGRTGLSDTMNVGAIADLALDDSIAFRVDFALGTAPRPEQLYFRGPVLASFDGKQWTTLRSRFPPSQQLPLEVRATSVPLQYSITLEPQRNPWLFALDVPAAAPNVEGLNVQLTPSLQLFTNKPVVERLRYRATSHLKAQYGPREMALGLQDFIELPPGRNPKAHAYAAELRRDARYATADAATLSRALMEQIRTEKFSYTLAPGVYGADSVDEFWFDRREGFCEHFAQAYVVMMRALDVPARIVTGYQGAELNPFDNSYIVRQSHAHAWAEYWQPGIGWVRADPTAAVAPERINTLNRTLAGQRGLFGVDALRGLNPTLLQQLRQGIDAVNNAWNQWVLSYNSQRQFDLMKSLGMKDPDWASVAVTMIGAALAGAAMIGLWFAWETWAWTKRRDPWARLWRKARAMLKREGIVIADHQAPRTASTQVQGLKLAAQWRAWLLELEALRYAPASHSGDKRYDLGYTKLKHALKALRP
jgi:protein-glutamine gamma-glutamyltransferase